MYTIYLATRVAPNQTRYVSWYRTADGTEARQNVKAIRKYMLRTSSRFGLVKTAKTGTVCELKV